MSPPSCISTGALLANMRWRYAVKRFQADRPIPADQWASLEQALLLCPSSYGLQPWLFVVVRDAALRERLCQASMGQRKVAESSHLVVFAARTNIAQADIDRWIARIAAVRQVPLADLAKLGGMMAGDLVTGPRHAVAAEWAARQAYLALGVFLAAAAVTGIDACPMEGFDHKAYDDILALDARGYTAVVIATAGYRSPDDTSAADAKVRYPSSDVIISV